MELLPDESGNAIAVGAVLIRLGEKRIEVLLDHWVEEAAETALRELPQ